MSFKRTMALFLVFCMCVSLFPSAAFADPEHEHVWDEGTVTTPATCTTDGVLTKTCTVEGCDKTKTEAIPALGHDYQAVVTEPTCTEAGYTTYTCSRCDDSHTADEVPALGHTITAVVAKAATCETAGNIAYWECTVCDKYFSDAEGTTEIAAAEVVIPATGHNWGDDGKCTNCNAELQIITGSGAGASGGVPGTPGNPIPDIPLPATYTVTFYANNGSGATSTQNFDSAALTLDANTFSRAGYTFLYWTVNQDGTGTRYADGAELTLDEAADFALYAQWTVAYPEAVVTSATNNDAVEVRPFEQVLDTSATPYGTVTPEKVYTFTAKDTADQARAGDFADWRCDYVVSMDQATPANSIGLFGAYGAWQDGTRIAFLSPVNAGAGEMIPLLGSMGGNNFWSYYNIASMVGTFACGAFNLSRENIGKTLTVRLVIWDENDPVYQSYQTAKVVEEIKYTFTEANFTPIYKDGKAYEYVGSGASGGDFGLSGFAPVPVASNGEDSNSSVQDAVAAVDEGESFTVTEQTTIGSVSVPAGSTVTVEESETVAGVTAKEVSITSGETTTTAYVVTSGERTAVFTGVTVTQNDSFTAEAGKTAEDYVDVAKLLATAVANNVVPVADSNSAPMTLSLSKTAATAANANGNETLAAVIAEAAEDENKAVFEVHPVITFAGSDYDASDFTTAGAEFTFTLKLGSRFAGKLVKLTHYKDNGDTEVFNTTANANGDVEVTLSSFSLLGAEPGSPVAKVGTTEYATIEEAVAAWGPGKTLTLLADVTYNQTVTVEVNATKATQNWFLDLGDYTWTTKGCNAFKLYAAGVTPIHMNYGLKISAENGGIDAGLKKVIQYEQDGKCTDSRGYRPLLEFKGGTYKGSSVVGHLSSASSSSPTGPAVDIFSSQNGKEPVFNGNLDTCRCRLRIFSGWFNGTIYTYTVSSTADAIFEGGHLKNLPTPKNDKIVQFKNWLFHRDGYWNFVSSEPTVYRAKVPANLVKYGSYSVTNRDGYTKPYVYFEDDNYAISNYNTIILNADIGATKNKTITDTLTIDTTAEDASYTGTVTLNGTSATFVLIDQRAAVGQVVTSLSSYYLVESVSGNTYTYSLSQTRVAEINGYSYTSLDNVAAAYPNGVSTGTFYVEPENPVSFADGYWAVEKTSGEWSVEKKPASISNGEETSFYTSVEEAVVAATAEDTEISINAEISFGGETLGKDTTLTVVKIGTAENSSTSETAKVIAVQTQGENPVTLYVVKSGDAEPTVIAAPTATVDNETITGTVTASQLVDVASVLAEAVIVGAAIDADTTVTVEISLSKLPDDDNTDAAIKAILDKGGKAFEVHPVATVTTTVGEQSSTATFTVSNGDLVENAPFTFSLALGNAYAGKNVLLKHFAESGTTEIGWFTADASGNVNGVQLSSFSPVTAEEATVTLYHDEDISYYLTLSEAIADAAANDRIVLSARDDFELPNTADIPAGVTIQGAGKNHTTVVITSESGSGITINQANVTIKDLTIDGKNITSGGYKTLVNVRADGCLIDNVIMTGGGTSTWNSSILVEKLPATATFTVSNSTISGAFRGVLRESCDANIVIESCDIDAVYPFNIDGGNNDPAKQGTVTVSNSELHGWSSYSAVKNVTFTNVEFSMGNSGYNVVAAYVDTEFEQCEFNTGNNNTFNVYAQKPDFTFTFNDCAKDGEHITDENLTTLFSDSDVWTKCETAIDVSTDESGSYITGTVVSATPPECAEGNFALKIGASADGKSNVFKIGKRIEITEPVLDTVVEDTAEYTVTLRLIDKNEDIAFEKANLTVTLEKETGLTVTEIDKMPGVVTAALKAVGAMASDVKTVTLKTKVNDTNAANGVYDVILVGDVQDANSKHLSDTAGASDTPDPFTVANGDLSGEFGFKLDLSAMNLGEGVTQVKVTHTSTGYPTETFAAAVTGNKIPVTVSHFSTFAVEALPVTANHVAVNLTNKIGYETLQGAISAASEGDTLALLDSFIESNIAVTGKAVTLDLNGKTLTANTIGFTLGLNGQLTVKDSGTNGKILVNGTDADAIQVGNINSAFTLESGTIEVDASTGNAINSTRGTVTVKGGSIIARNAVYGIHNNSTAAVTVSGGTIEAKVGIYNPQGGNVTVSGGTITGRTYPIQNVDGGMAAISAGQINGTLYSTYPNLLEVTGGTFTVDPDGYAATGYVSWANADETYTVLPAVTVTFYANTGVFTSGAVTEFLVASGKSFNDAVAAKGYAAPVATKAAHSFEGWSTNASATATDVDLDDQLSENAAFYAVWKEATASVTDSTTGVIRYYGSLAEAISAVEPNALEPTTVRLYKDVTENVAIEIKNGQNIALDLGGKTATLNYIDLYDAKLSVSNGTIKGTVYVNGGKADAASGYNSFTLNSGATIDAQYGVILYQSADNTAYGSTVNLNGTVAGNVWVMGNILAGNSVINVNGTVDATGKSDVGIALNGMATVNVNDGAVVTSALDGKGTGIEVRSGTLNVTGGTITGTGAYAFNPNGSGTTSTGVGIAVAQHTTEKNIQVNISGNPVVNGTVALAIANPQQNDDGTLNVNVTNGTFNGASGDVAVVLDAGETRVNGFISGGSFSSRLEVTYCADDYIPSEADSQGRYTVTDGWKITFDAKNGTTNTVVGVAKNGTVARPDPDPIKQDCTFANWFKQGETTAFDFENTQITADTTIEAHWTGDVTYTVAITGWVYGEAANAPAVTAKLVGVDVTADTNATSATFQYKLTSAEDSAYSNDVPTQAGAYTVRATVTSSALYTGGTATAEFTIAQRPITVKADDASKVAGNVDPAFTYAITSGTLATGDAPTVTYTRVPDNDSETSSTITPSVVIKKGDAEVTANYAVTIETGTLTIASAVASITKGDPEETTFYASLVDAVDKAGAGETVKLLADVSLSTNHLPSAESGQNAALWITKSLTLDGAKADGSGNYTITLSNTARGVCVRGSGDESAPNVVTLQHLTIVDGDSTNTHVVDTRCGGEMSYLTLNLDDVVLSTPYNAGQPLTIGGTHTNKIKVNVTDSKLSSIQNGYAISVFHPVNLNISGTEMGAWAALNMKLGSAGSVVTVDDSKITSIGQVNGTSNAFAAIKFEDDDIEVTVTNTEINIVANSDQKTGIVSSSYYNVDNSSLILGEGNVVTFSGTNPENAVVAVSIGNDYNYYGYSMANVAITGGYFSNPVPAQYAGDNLIPGERTAEDHIYTVVTGYKVTFDPVFDSKIVVGVPKNTPVAEPVAPVMDFFEFAGWYLDPDDDDAEPYDFSQPVASDITLIAKWSEAVASITRTVAGEEVTSYYATFARASEARNGDYSVVINLLDEVNLPYTMAAGETLKVVKDGLDLTVYAPEKYTLETSEPDTYGVTTYTLIETPIDVWVGGRQITEVNAPDVFGDGTVSYDPTTKTLTLNGYTYSGAGYEKSAIYAAGDLNIVVEGTNSLTSTAANGFGIYTGGSLAITGSGTVPTLNVTAATSTGFAIKAAGASASITGVTMELAGNRGIVVNENNANGDTITIHSSTITFASGMDRSMQAWNSEGDASLVIEDSTLNGVGRVLITADGDTGDANISIEDSSVTLSGTYGIQCESYNGDSTVNIESSTVAVTATTSAKGAINVGARYGNGKKAAVNIVNHSDVTLTGAQSGLNVWTWGEAGTQMSTEINVTDSTLTTNGYCYGLSSYAYPAGDTTVTVTNSTASLTGGVSGVELCSDSSYNCVGTKTYHQVNSNVTVTGGYFGLDVDTSTSNHNNTGASVVQIDGGSLTSNGGLYVTGDSDDSSVTLSGNVVIDMTGIDGVDPIETDTLNIASGTYTITGADGEDITVATGNITGGYFTTDVTDACADDYGVFPNTDANSATYPYKVGPITDAVAKIVSTYYPTLQAAVDAAADGDTVTVLVGIDSLAQRVDVEKSITIDLNGKTVKPTSTATNGSAFNIKSGTVTIKNGTLDGTNVTEVAGSTTATQVGSNDGICLVTVRSGATLNLADGVIMVVNSKNGCCVYPFAGGRVNISGGTYENRTTEAYQYKDGFKGLTVNQANVDAQLVHITGGTFIGNDPQLGDDHGARAVELGFVAIKDGDNYVVQEGANITFVNDDAEHTVLLTLRVAKGGAVAYTGENPAKAADANGVYTWIGWNDGTTDYGTTATLPVATTTDITYTATYSSVDSEASVTVGTGADAVTTYYATFGEAMTVANAATVTAENPALVTLLSDVSVSAPVMISNHVTLDGNSHKITSSANRGVRVDTNSVTVTVKNLTIQGSSLERAIQVDSGVDNVTLIIDNVTATATMYTVNICGSVDNLALTVRNSDLTGWGVINLWGNNGTVLVENTKLTGVNDKSYNADGWNNFGIIVFEGDTTGQTSEHSTAYDVTVKNCEIKATSTTGNTQYALLHNDPSGLNELKLDSCTVDLGQNCEFFAPTGSSLESITKVKDTVITGTTQIPALPAGFVYVPDAQGYEVVTEAAACVTAGSPAETTYYATLEQAVAAATDGATVTLLKDSSGNGIVIPQGKFGSTGLVIDLADHTYTLSGDPVGSSGTEYIGFQLLKGNKLTFEDGSIKVGSETTGTRKFLRVFQSYADVTFNCVSIDGTQLVGNNAAAEFCNGDVEIIGNSNFTSKTGVPAINVDAWNGSYPDGAHVTVYTSGAITGIYCYTEGSGAEASSNLHIEAGTVGTLTVADGSTVTVTKEKDAAVTAPDGYAWTKKDEYSDILGPVVATITTGETTVGYATLADAVTAAAAGDTVTLEANVALTATQAIEKNLTLNLNGKNITANGVRALHVKSGEVSIVDSSAGETKGTITSTHTDGDGFNKDSSVIRVGDSGAAKAKLSIGAGVTVAAPYSYGVTVFGTNTNGVELVVNGTVAATGLNGAISGNGNSGNKGAVTVNEGAVVSSTVDAAIYHPQNDTLTINGGTITGPTAVYVKSGTVAINGGTLTGNGVAAAYSYNGDGCNATGDALVVDNCNYPGGAPSVTVSGGSFNSTNGKGIGSYHGNTATELAPVIAKNTTSIINGQVWVTNDDADTKTEYPYKLVKLTEVAAKVTNNNVDSYYVTLAEAVAAAAQTGDTITLLNDVALTSTQEINKSFTLDLNGKNITATDARALWVKSGDVSIVNTGKDANDQPVGGTISAAHGTGSFASSSSVIRVGDGAANENAAKLTVGTGVTVSSDYCYGVTVFGVNNDNNDSTTDIELVVNGTVAVTGEQAAISGNGTNTLSATTMTVNGTVTATQDYAIYHPGKGTLTVSGTVEGKGGIEVKSGAVTINNGATVTATATEQSHSINNNGTSTSGYAIAAVNNAGYVGDPTVTISGGTVTGKTVIIADGDKLNGATVTKTGGAADAADGFAWSTTSNRLLKQVTVTAADKSKVYGADDPALTATVEGLVTGDTLSYTLSRAAGENVGTYPITPSGAAEQGNYAVTYVPATFTITKATATVTADAKSKIYGAADPELTATVTGLVGSDTLSYTLARAEGENAGGYTITVTLGENPNYDVTATNGTFTINKKAATVTADAKSKVAGNADPALTATVTGLVGSDTLNYTLARAAGETAGEYTITVTLSENPNYDVTATNGTFTISGAVASITRNGQTTHYATLQGAVNEAENGDTVTLLDNINALAERVNVAKSITIDLNGKTIKPASTAANGSAFNIVSGTVTLKNGTIDGTGVVEDQPGGVTVANGICLVTVRSGATLNLSDSNLYMVVNSKNGCCVYPFAGGTVNISGGTYENKTTEDYQYKAGFKGLTVNQANNQGQLIHITGGTFKGNDPQLGDDSNGARAVNLGYVAMPGTNGFTVVEGGVVTFDTDGGTEVPEQRIDKGGKVTKPADPTKENNEFAGWYLVSVDATTGAETLAENAWVFNTDTVTTDVTLKAKWLTAVATITKNSTTSYYASLRNAVANAADGDTIELIANDPITFADGGLVIDKNLTIDGKDYTVTGLTEYGLANVGSPAEITDSNVHGFYIKSGNVTIKNLNMTQFGDTDYVNKFGLVPVMTASSYSGTLTLNNVSIDKFNRQAICILGGSFSITGGTITGNATNKGDGFDHFQQPIEIRGGSGTIDGVTIRGGGSNVGYSGGAIVSWSSGNVTVNNVDIDVTGNGIWADYNTVNVTGDNTVVKATDKALFVEDGGTLTVSGKGSFTGAVAVDTNANSSIAISDGYYSATVDPAYMADGKLCTVTLKENGMYYVVDAVQVKVDPNGGSFKTTDTTGYTFTEDGTSRTYLVPKGESFKIGAANMIAEAGYTLAAWTYSDGITAEIPAEFEGTVNASISLKAEWTELFTVTFDADGGTPVPEAQTVEKDKYATYPEPTPTKTGYSFDGWFLEGNDTAFKFGTTKITGNITLKAKWTATKYSIIWMNDDDTILDTQMVAYGQTPSTNVQPAKAPNGATTYTFKAWDPAIAAVTGEAIYKATYEATENEAKVGDTYFVTLAEAITYANTNGGTVELLKDIEVENTKSGTNAIFDLNAAITLDGGGHTITVTGTGNGNVFNVNAGAAIQDLKIVGGNSGHGFNLYQASGVTMNNVEISGCTKFGVNVNSSTLTATDLKVGQTTGWGKSIGIDPKHGNASLTIGGENTDIAAAIDVDTNNNSNTNTVTLNGGIYAGILMTNGTGATVSKAAEGVTVTSIPDNYTWVENVLKPNFTVTWKNGNEVLETDEHVVEGTMPEYNGAEPTKPADDEYTYTFAGWSLDGTNVLTELPAVTADAIYKATYTATAHTVTLANYTTARTPATVKANGTEVVNGNAITGRTFTVTCDKACVVAWTNDAGATWNRLAATAVEGDTNTYSFTLPDNATGSITVAVALKGDVNLNGRVNSQDISLIQKSLLNAERFTGFEALVVDVQGDGRINTKDMTAIQSVLLRKPNSEFAWELANS